MAIASRVISSTLLGASIIQIEAFLDDGSHHFSRFELDPIIGNQDGRFSIEGAYFSRSARNTRLEGLTLRSELRSLDGQWRESLATVEVVLPTQARADDIRVELFTKTTDHALAIRIPDPQVAEHESWSLQCHGQQVWLHYTSSSIPIVRSPCVDLASCIGNSDGSFDTNGILFSISARNIRLSGTILQAQLATRDGKWNYCSLDMRHLVKTQCALHNLKFEAFQVLSCRNYIAIKTDSSPCPTASKRPSAVYTPLNLTAGDIRLCRIRKGERDAPIECDLTIRQHSIGEAYRCLSYVWGSSTIEMSISVNRKPRQVTYNLFQALRGLRSTTDDGTFWIDALCINQGDVREKGAQVARMGQIYRNAESVIVWLGGESVLQSGSDTTAKSQRSNSVLLQETINHMANGGHICNIPGLFSNNEAKDLTKGLDFDRIIFSLRIFSEAPWWKRTWTFQEVILPECVNVVFDLAEFAWSDLSRAASSMDHHRSHCRTCSRATIQLDTSQISNLEGWSTKVTALNRCRTLFRQRILGQIHVSNVRRLSWPQRLHSMAFSALRLAGLISSPKTAQGRAWNTALSLMSTCGPSSSSDLRDKVFGLVSLLPKTGEPFPVDYSLNVEQVYRKFTLHMMKMTRSFSVWNVQSSNRGTATQDPGKLPSWIIDWRSGVDNRSVNAITRIMITQGFKVTATSWTPPEEIDSEVLSVEGAVVDSVASVTEKTWPYFVVGERDAGDRLKDWQDFAYTAGAATYPTGETLQCAFWRTMMNDHVTGVDTEGEFAARRAQGRDVKYWTAWVKEISQTPSDGTGLDSLRRDVVTGHFSVTFSAAGKSMFATAKGYIGLGPEMVSTNDVVCILKGGRETPYLLRPAILHRLHSEQHPVYTLVGPVYVHGIMHGELDRLLQDPVTVYLC